MLLKYNMKVVTGSSEVPGMNREEVERFLESKLNLQIATIDEKGEPNIHPVWFYYDKDEGKLFMTSFKLAKKTQNLQRKPSIYFSIDYENYDGNIPPKGVKGKGIATIVQDPNRIVPKGDRISMKYLGTLDHPIAKMLSDSAKKEDLVLVEISPKFFSTWDYGKMQ
ncbi:MAG: pyridoxamine 5'-phosphate oxidase family protein [Thermoproteota archaeon]|nr:pyridoxamine 5'-phosphate oxidase family protein [Thermoproteota archaeon]